MKRRFLYAICSLLLFGVMVLIALFVRDRFIRPYFGDVLVVIFIGCAIRVFIPEGLRLLPFFVFLFASGVEVAQYFHIAERLGLDAYPVLSVAVGGTFSLPDLLCYGAGCLFLFTIEEIFRKKQKNT